PSRPRCCDEHEDHQNYGDRRHIRIIADAIGAMVDETQISTLARCGHAELPSTLSGFAGWYYSAIAAMDGPSPSVAPSPPALRRRACGRRPRDSREDPRDNPCEAIPWLPPCNQ